MGEHNGVIGGVSEIVAVDFKPWWEGIEGTVTVDHVTGHLTPQEAYERVLNWQVLERDVKVDVAIDDEPEQLITVPNKKALVRSDTKHVLGIHSRDFGTQQNEVVRDFLETIKLVNSDIEVISSGGLFDGEVVWMLAKLAEDKHFLDRDERIAKYFCVSNGHDGKHALRAAPTETRVECMNTFAMYEQCPADVVIRHTKNADARVKEAKLILDNLYAHSAQLDAEIAELLSQPFTEAEYKGRIVTALNPKPAPELVDGAWKITPRKLTNWEKRRDGLVAAYYRDDAANIKGTAWGAVMGVNSYELWSQKVVGTSRPENQARKALTHQFPLTQLTRQLVAS